jgi:hypothetical protein
MKRISVVTSATGALFIAALFVAPNASADVAVACGELTNGDLCIHRLDSTISGDFKTSYWKTGGSTVTIKLGHQAKTPSGKISDKTYDGAWHDVADGGYMSKTRYLTLDNDWCVRGVMKDDNGNSFVSKWTCI